MVPVHDTGDTMRVGACVNEGVSSGVGRETENRGEHTIAVETIASSLVESITSAAGRRESVIEHYELILDKTNRVSIPGYCCSETGTEGEMENSIPQTI